MTARQAEQTCRLMKQGDAFYVPPSSVVEGYRNVQFIRMTFIEHTKFAERGTSHDIRRFRPFQHYDVN